MKMDITEIQRKINNIVVKLSAEDDDDDICNLLLDLKPLLEGELNKSTRTLTILSEIWRCGLPQKILIFLKEKESYINKYPLNACHLCSIAVDCCIGYTLDTVYLSSDFIPDLTYTILKTLTKMVNQFSKVEKQFQPNLCGNISWIVRVLGKLAESFISTSITMVSSKYFMQLLMIEDTSISLIALSFLKSIIKSNQTIFYHVAESRAHSIVEELTFKLFGSADGGVAKVSLSVLLTLLDIHPTLLELFASKRYRGFKTYITKLQGKGFDNEIKKLLVILEAQSKRLLASQKQENAAIVIQSCYKGYKLRKRLHRASIAIAKFQRIYRGKRIKTYEQRTQNNLDKMKTQHIEADRRKAFVDSRMKQLKIIETIPAKTVNKFLEDHEQESAKGIQAAWKGYRTRKIMEQLKPEMKKEKAAIVIQKQIRKWLERRRLKHASSLIALLPAGLDDQRKVELQRVIGNIRNRSPARCQTDLELHDIHERSFRKLNNHMIALHQARRQDERRKALMAQLSVLSDQLLHAPNLNSVDSNHVEQYASYSTPIIVAARQQHLDYMNAQKMAWWKKLENENIIENNANISKNNFYSNDEKQF